MKAKFLKTSTSTYYIVEGSTITENYNETLDSAVIRISHVFNNPLNLEPFDNVVLIDDIDGQGTKRLNDKYMCINTWREKQINLDPVVYEYEIELFSETKKLEGIVLPNLSITKNPGVTRTIYEYLQQFLDEYCTKIRTSGDSSDWYNKFNLATYHNDSDNVLLSDKFNVECPEMQWNNPTLREVLTDLMMVVDCIPVLRNNVIDYIDLTEKFTDIKAHELELDNDKKHLNYITRHQSSDNYASELRMTMQNVQNHNEDQNKATTCEYFTVITDGALLADNNIFVELEHSIARVKHMYFLGFEFVTGSNGNPSADYVRMIDLCDFDTPNTTHNNAVYEYADYKTLPVAYSSASVDDDNFFKYQNFALCYTRGGNRIENFQSANRGYQVFFNYSSEYVFTKWIKFLIGGNNATHFLRMFFKIEYETYDENVIQFSKKDGLWKNQKVTLDNQSESYIDNFKTGNLEQLKVNRIGNPQKMINARFEDDYENLYKIGDYYDNCIVYQTQYQIYDNHIEVNMFAMEDYILRDYFTGVKARSRSWKIVSGSDALSRHDLIKFYCLLDFEDYATGLKLEPYVDNILRSDLILDTWHEIQPSTKYVIENFQGRIDEYAQMYGSPVNSINISSAQETFTTTSQTVFVRLVPRGNPQGVRLYVAKSLDFNIAKYLLSPLLDLDGFKPIKHIAVQYIDSNNTIYPTRNTLDDQLIPSAISGSGSNEPWEPPEEDIYIMYDVISRVSGKSLTFTFGNNDNYVVKRKPMVSKSQLTNADPFGIYPKTESSIETYLGSTSYKGWRTEYVYYADGNGENVEQNILLLDDYNNIPCLYEKIEDYLEQDIDVDRAQLFYALQYQQPKVYSQGFGESATNPTSYVKCFFTTHFKKDNREILKDSIQFEFIEMNKNITIGERFLTLQKATRQNKADNSGELELIPNQWIQLGGEYTLQNNVIMTGGIDPGSGIYYGNYSITIVGMIGQNLSSITIDQTLSGYTNTVNFDSSTGTFSGTVYSNNSVSQIANIHYVIQGQETPRWRGTVTSSVQTNLIGATLYGINVSPESSVSGAENYAAFNSYNGTFSLTVWLANNPVVSPTYTIRYKILELNSQVTLLRFFEGGDYYSGMKFVPNNATEISRDEYQIQDGGEAGENDFCYDFRKSIYALRIKKSTGNITLPLFITDLNGNLIIALNEFQYLNQHDRIDLYLSLFNSNDIYIYNNDGTKSEPGGDDYIFGEEL